MVDRIIHLIDEKLSLKDETYNSLNVLCYLKISNYIEKFQNLL